MNKAFIFDMDGVIIDSERTWASYEKSLHKKIFGKTIADKVDSSQFVGLSISNIYDIVVPLGYTETLVEFYTRYDAMAEKVYQKAKITDGLEDILRLLENRNYKIALVSASPVLWINWVVEKAGIASYFDYILSLHERNDLQHKPAPDGFLEAIKMLESSPEETIILEDSFHGIQAGKASGAFTIGFQEHLLPGYKQEGADAYVKNMEELQLLLRSTF